MVPLLEPYLSDLSALSRPDGGMMDVGAEETEVGGETGRGGALLCSSVSLPALPLLRASRKLMG